MGSVLELSERIRSVFVVRRSFVLGVLLDFFNFPKVRGLSFTYIIAYMICFIGGLGSRVVQRVDCGVIFMFVVVIEFSLVKTCYLMLENVYVVAYACELFRNFFNKVNMNGVGCGVK